MRVLALDQSSTICGYALIETAGVHPDAFGNSQPGKLLESGLIHSPEKNDIRRVLDIGARIKAKLLAAQAEKLVIEGHTYATMQTADTTERLAAVTFLARYVAQEIGLTEPMRVYTGTMKLVAGGHGKADKEMVRAGTCRFWGLDPAKFNNDNETDALGIAQAFLAKKGKR